MAIVGIRPCLKWIIRVAIGQGRRVRFAPKATIQGMSPKWRDGPDSDMGRYSITSTARRSNTVGP